MYNKSLKANKMIKLNNLDFAHMQVSGIFVLVKGLFTIVTCILRYLFLAVTPLFTGILRYVFLLSYVSTYLF